MTQIEKRVKVALPAAQASAVRYVRAIKQLIEDHEARVARSLTLLNDRIREIVSRTDEPSTDTPDHHVDQQSETAH